MTGDVMHTEEELKEAIAAIEWEYETQLPAYTIFGYDNRAEGRCHVDLLKEVLNGVYVEDLLDDLPDIVRRRGMDEDCYLNAADVLYWVNGEEEDLLSGILERYRERKK